MRKANRTGRDGIASRYVRLNHYMLNCPAWRALDAVARAIYVDMSKRYAGPGSNNGRIPYAVREGVSELRISKATVSRALAKLIEHGFIRPTTKGAFSLKRRHATEWLLTEHPSDVTNEALPAKDFMKWGPQPPTHQEPRCSHYGTGNIEVSPS